MPTHKRNTMPPARVTTGRFCLAVVFAVLAFCAAIGAMQSYRLYAELKANMGNADAIGEFFGASVAFTSLGAVGLAAVVIAAVLTVIFLALAIYFSIPKRG